MKKVNEYRHYALYARREAQKAKSQPDMLVWLQTANYLDRAALLRLQTLRKGHDGRKKKQLNNKVHASSTP